MGIRKSRESCSDLDMYGAVLEVGNFLLVLGLYQNAAKRVLSDGTVIRYGDRYGSIHLIIDLPEVTPDENIITATKAILKLAQISLKDLAHMAATDSRLEHILVYGGEGHIAKIGPHAGFDVFPIADDARRAEATQISLSWAQSVAGQHPLWDPAHYEAAHEAFISRDKLIRLHR